MNARKHLNVQVVLIACGMLTVPLLAHERVNPNDPPHGLFSDEWVELHLAGGKVGYGHMSYTREGDKIRARNNFVMQLGRVDQDLRIEMNQYTVETIDGKPLEFGTELDASAIKTNTTGTVKGGKVTIITSQLGMDQTQTFDFPEGAVMTWGTYRESLLRGFKPETEYTLRVYAPELRLDDAVDAVTNIGGFEAFDLHGEHRMLQRMTVTMQTPLGSTEMVSWIDKTGRVLHAEVPMPGLGDMVLVATDQASAMREFVPPEIFMTTTIKAGRKIDRAKTKRIVYTMKPKNPETEAELDKLPDTAMQSVTPKDRGAVQVVVTRLAHEKPLTKATELSKDELAEYLGANLMINTEDPELIALANRAAQGEKDPYKLADNLRRFVTEYIENRNLNIGFATASEVCRNKEGDCSEHGVLLAALGRISGLPSRVVAGIAYVPLFGKQDDIFGYHMWTQFYIDGRWVDVDAALRETECSPARIAFAVSSLKNAGMADLSLPLINKIGAIDMKIESVETE